MLDAGAEFRLLTWPEEQAEFLMGEGHVAEGVEFSVELLQAPAPGIGFEL